MSIRSNSLSASTAFAVAVATITSAGSAAAADLPAKAPAVQETPFFILNDNSVSFTWYPTATNPGVAKDGIAGQSNSFNKYVASMTHFDVWAYGSNFINLDILKSDSNDPIGGTFGPNATGATELYAFARSTLSGNALSNSKMFSSFLFKDISFEWGGDINTDNDFFRPQKRDIVLGAEFTLNVPGVVNFAVLAYKEWNHGTPFEVPGLFSGDREFQWIPRLELFISEPLTFLPLPVTWISFTGVNFPKGSGISPANLAAIGGTGPGSGPFTGANFFTANNASAFTKTEVFEDNRLTLDASKLAWGKAGIWDVYAGYRYWYNKFGTDHNAAVFAHFAPRSDIESTAYVGTTYHFK
jgi:hypothetical protein